jgi:ubiquilin
LLKNNIYRNPELMREMQRNNDRALSNIEAIPGGFNHLRRMYNTFQSPMESALSPGGTSSSDEANERLARELNVESVPENSLNTQALPNPWAAPANNNNNNNTSSSTPAASAAANPFAALGGGGGSGGENPLAGKTNMNSLFSP